MRGGLEKLGRGTNGRTGDALSPTLRFACAEFNAEFPSEGDVTIYGTGGVGGSVVQ